MSRPPLNLDQIEADTLVGLSKGYAVLQTHYYGQTDAEHVWKLLEWLAPTVGATVIDAGCGVGEVSRLMAGMRSDLGFLLINVSPLQLALSPDDDGERFLKIEADCHDLSGCVPDGFAEAIMYSSALCQMDAPVALAEACRVLKDGGILLINDMATMSENADMERVLAARVMQASELESLVIAAGFDIDFTLKPEGSDTHFRSMLAEAGCEHMIDGVFPIVIRATKRGAT